MGIEVGQVEVDGRTLAYRRAGEGPPLVLLHGGWSDGREWRLQLESLSDEFTVIAWDAPGCGGSSDPPEEFGLSGYADAVAGLVGALGIDRPHLLGLSFGGGLAIRCSTGTRGSRVAGARGCVRRVGGVVAGRCRGRTAAASARRGRPAAGGVGPGLSPRVLRPPSRPRLSTRCWRSCTTAVPGASSRWCGPSPPPTCATSSADRRADAPPLRRARRPGSSEVADALHAGIPGSELVIVPGVGHVVNVEARARFDAEVRRFLRTVDA